MADREFKGVWIPREIWLDERLNALEKVILAEIDSLDHGAPDYCWKSNENLAAFCQCSVTKVSNAVSKLIDLGYVRVASFDGRKRRLHSCLTISVMQSYKKHKADLQNLQTSNTFSNPSSNTCDIKNTSYSCQEPSKDASTPPVYTLPLNDGTNHEITNEDYEKYKRLYPSVDVMAEFRKMDGWFDGHPSRRKTRKGIRRFINSWLGKEQDNGGTKHNSVSNTPPSPPPEPPKPMRSRRMVVRLLDDLHMEQMGVLYEDGEIKARGKFYYARVNGVDLGLEGDETTKRWEDAKCDRGKQWSDFFP